MPNRTASSTLLLGTWNIRNFDDNRFGYGPRLEESFYYLAEMIAAFDIIAVQEICDDLTPFEQLMSILGPTHTFIITDITEGPGGNSERLGFIFNRSKITFKGIAGEIVLPFEQQISDVTKERQFARTPFSCTFQAGWFKFNFATVHIYYGADSINSAEYKRRVAEIDSVARFIANRAKADVAYNHILVGDFNIENFEGQTFDALAKHGFQVFRNKEGSNAKQTKFYDQISFLPKKDEVALANPESGKAHGVFNLFSCVFRDEDFSEHDPSLLQIINKRIAGARVDLAKAEQEFAAATSESKKKVATKAIAAANVSIAADTKLIDDKAARLAYYLDEWRTFQMSDHLPLFVELKIDFADNYLDQLRAEVEGQPGID
ncbi:MULTISPECIES: endonuclease/exonuclease/phosphatase family protein [unclassified Mesorhizobium]|uniref:endonuclease/exonuclease/phosphatase family protein n=1 Tax=unclassified Mesorhizobium TaxID=325217 RepID=UPI001AEE5E06|nr:MULTISPECIES: endonuclease/exonuclease/phosphatase family protein [unclassified Mesorhizobium]